VLINGLAISNSGRTALWIRNLNGGTIQNNTVAGYALYPQLAQWGTSQVFANQFTADFMVP
jgi:hypothetical protein